MIKVMVVDDYAPTLTKITAFIEQTDGYQVIASLTDGQDTIHFLRNAKILPDIVILDIQMWKVDGITTMDYLHDFFPEMKVVALSAFIQGNVVEDMFAGGAYAFVWKENCFSYLKEALQKVVHNQPYADPRIGFDIGLRQKLIDDRQVEKQVLYNQYKLTGREIEIIKLIASDMDYKEIYSILHIAPRTIETHIKNINNKMKIKGGRASLLLHVLRNGLAKIANLTKHHHH